MDFGLFLEFPRGEGMTEQEAIQESFAVVDEAESLGVDSVWLAEYHFNPGRILSAPITIASAIHPGPHKPGPSGIWRGTGHFP
jgi:hypothetical protein